jgi:Activator of Hsp90 ATPase homolog 1-like protein.
MENNLSFSLVVSKSPEYVYKAINNVSAWWSEDFKGKSQQPNDEFEVRFADVHYSKHTVEELVPGKKVVWLTTDSHLSFLEDKAEWTGTRIIFDIQPQNGKTSITFTHIGLTPACECFKDCNNGWMHYLEGSLVPLIEKGKGQPNVLDEEVAKKSAQ